VIVGLIALSVVWRVVRRVAPAVAGRWWSKWAAAGVVVVGAIAWSYATNRQTSWAFLRPADWAWWCPTWEGFGAAGHASWWPFGWERQTGVIFTPLAIVLASAFVTFPFVGRSLIPLMEAQGVEAEQAAISLGAGGWYTFRRVTLPSIKWGLLYGVILCSARAFGEFGAVSVVSGHLNANNTMPLRIEQLWQEYKTQAAFTVASLLAMLAVVTLVVKTFIEWKTRRESDEEGAGPKPVLGAVARH
jgi:ABC-type Fe3+ transport system permease subunit